MLLRILKKKVRFILFCSFLLRSLENISAIFVLNLVYKFSSETQSIFNLFFNRNWIFILTFCVLIYFAIVKFIEVVSHVRIHHAVIKMWKENRLLSVNVFKKFRNQITSIWFETYEFNISASSTDITLLVNTISWCTTVS